MNYREILGSSAVAGFILMAIFSGILLFLDCNASHNLARGGLTVWYLLGLIFILSFFMRFLHENLDDLLPVTSHGLYWASRIISLWLLVCMTLAILLRLDFSVGGGGRALFFFLWPVEILLEYAQAAKLFMLGITGFAFFFAIEVVVRLRRS